MCGDKRDGRPIGSRSLWGAEGSVGDSQLCLKRELFNNNENKLFMYAIV